MRFPDWKGKVCAVVASGASVTREALKSLEGRCRVVVVNNGFEIAPWADVLYAADRGWWEAYPKARDFAGLKFSSAQSVLPKAWGVSGVEVDPSEHRLVLKDCDAIGHGGHSGFQALNLAVRCGPKRILLVGFDYVGAHWHENHVLPLRNPRQAAMDKWCERLDRQAEVFLANGIEVINASTVSRLSEYPKMTVVEALEKWA